MPSPGFDDPALASLAPAGNLYYDTDVAVGAKLPTVPSNTMELNDPGYAANRSAPPIMFGAGTATDGEGAAIVNASNSSKGHVSEILNFHGSPAPWILIGILLAAGILHLEAGAKFKGSL